MYIIKKETVLEQLTDQNIFQLLTEWGGEPEYTNFGIISATICHNLPGQGSKKLYWYSNNNLFHCYTGCAASFDVFELVQKVFKIQKNQDMGLFDAIRYIAARFGIATGLPQQEESFAAEDWNKFNEYDKVKNLDIQQIKLIELKEYDRSILNNLNYSIKLVPWLKEGISQETLQRAKIGYYPGGDQITIPHFDINNRFIGLRGRTMCETDSEIFGKYRPVYINKTLYNHPLGLNLYNINLSKENIKQAQTAIVFESEKSTLLYQTYFGSENDISVACCGSALSQYQIFLLQQLGVKEIIVAFDRQFQEIGDKEHQHLKNNLLKLYERNHNDLKISFIFDKNMITGYKASPIDEGKDKFIQLFKERIFL